MRNPRETLDAAHPKPLPMRPAGVSRDRLWTSIWLRAGAAKYRSLRVWQRRFANMPDEEMHERGREGVGMIKAWLEATTWMDFPFNAHEDETRCTALLLEGTKKVRPSRMAPRG